MNASPYSKETKKCRLCTMERIEIMKLHKSEPQRALNKRDELIGMCRHRRKHLLGMIAQDKTRKTHEVGSPNAAKELPKTQRDKTKRSQPNRVQTHEILPVVDTVLVQNETQEDVYSGRTRSGKAWRVGDRIYDPG